MDPKILIQESFDDDVSIFDKVAKREFESSNALRLRVAAEELSQESTITELVSYDLIKKHLEYALPHQPEGALKILRDMNGSALLADEVGLGKTITTGIIIRECVERDFLKRALILTPPSLVDQWVAEMRDKFELDFKIIESEADWEKAQFAVASIDRVKSFDKNKGMFRHAKAHDIGWDLLVVDEAHKLKDRNTVRWVFVDKLQKKRFLILTATPFQNDLLELYNLLHLLKRGHLGTLKEFKKQFLFRGNKRHPLNPEELRRKLNEVMVRRRRDQTLVNYMKRIPTIVPVDLTPEEFDAYNAICDFLKTKYFSHTGSEISGRLIIYAILPKITSSSRSAMESLERIVQDQKYHEATRDMAARILEQYKALKVDSKIEMLVKTIDGILKEDPKAKMLIYTRHPTTLRYIVEKLQPFNLHIVEFLGGLEREERTKRIQEFREKGQVMISTDTGAEGLNFQFCNVLINYDLPWNPMSVEQRIGRLDRIGQKRDMKIFSFATKRTMEEHVVDLIINKMCCIGLVIGELPIILFNLGLDGNSEHGVHRIEEMLMNAFLDSKNNLDVFANGVESIHTMIQKGIDSYEEAKGVNKKLLNEG